MNALLFAATVLIWGSTWIAIAVEVGPVPVLVSVFYRFALAALILLPVLAVSRRLRVPTPISAALFGTYPSSGGSKNAALIAVGSLTVPALRHQPFILAQALCLFSCNFLCFYTAAAEVPSGLISVVFSLATLFNAVNARILFGTPITGRTALAAALGVAGLALLFGRDVAIGLDAGTLKGVGLAVLGTLFFSLGNMASRRNSAAGIPPVVANAWGMAYGALVLLALIGLTGTPMVAPPGAAYVAALLYLAAVGSVVGFTTYLMLVARVGSSRAAYATVLFPIVALALSTLFEGYRWHWTGVLGLLLALLGNLVMFRRATSPGGARRFSPRLSQ